MIAKYRCNRIDRKRLLISLLIMFVCTILISSVTAYAAKRKINKKTLCMHVGEKAELFILNNKKKVKWTSKNKKIATVSKKGTVTAKAIGTTYIIAKVGGKKLKCKVTVSQQGITDLTPYIGNSIKPLLKQVNFVEDKSRYRQEGIISYYYGNGVTEKNYTYTDNTPTVEIDCKRYMVTDINIYCWKGEEQSEADAKVFSYYGLTLPVLMEKAEEVLSGKGFSSVKKVKNRNQYGNIYYNEIFQNSTVRITLETLPDDPSFWYIWSEPIN